MHLKPAMFLKLGSFLPRFVFSNKCLEFAYFKVEVVSLYIYLATYCILSRNRSSIKNTDIKKGVSLPSKFLRLIFLLSSKKIILMNYQCSFLFLGCVCVLFVLFYCLLALQKLFQYITLSHFFAILSLCRYIFQRDFVVCRICPFT